MILNPNKKNLSHVKKQPKSQLKQLNLRNKKRLNLVKKWNLNQQQRLNQKNQLNLIQLNFFNFFYKMDWKTFEENMIKELETYKGAKLEAFMADFRKEHIDYE